MKVTLFIHARCSAKFAEAPKIFVSICHHTSDQWDTYVLLQTNEVEVPDVEIDLKAFTITQIEQLQEEIKAEEAASYMRIVVMKETIQSLMCLEQK